MDATDEFDLYRKWVEFYPYQGRGFGRPVTLKRGRVDVRFSDGVTETCKGLLEWRWNPNAKLSWKVHSARSPWDGVFSGLEIEEIAFEGFGVLPSPLCLSVRGSSKAQGTVYAGTSGSGGWLGVGSKAAACVFMVPSFRVESGRKTTYSCKTGTGFRSSGVLVEYSDWALAVFPGRHFDGDRDKRKSSGRSGAEFVGVLTRRDGKDFPYDECSMLLDDFGTVVSFAHERDVRPVLPVGIAANGDVVFNSIGNWSVSRLASSRGWYASGDGRMLEEAIAKYSQLDQNSTEREALHAAIYFHLNAAKPGLGSEIPTVLLQAAGEALAYGIVSESRQMISEESLGKLPAHDFLRLLLSVSGIPTSLPSKLLELGKLAKEHNLRGAPEVAVNIRNKIVHPTRKNHNKLYGAGSALRLHEARELWFWMIELLILRHMGYSGKYANRMHAGKYPYDEPVPWATTT